MFLRFTNGGKPRTISLDPATVAMLRAMRRSDRSPYVFLNDGNEGWHHDISTRLWQFGQEVQFGARLHDLCHAFAVRKLTEGWSIYRVSAHPGNSSVTTTKRSCCRYLTDEQQMKARGSGENAFD